MTDYGLVFKEKFSLVWKKFLRNFLYSLGLYAITWILNYVTVLELPPEQMLYGSLAISLLTALKKGFETYDPSLDK